MRQALYSYLTTNCVSIPTWFQPYQQTGKTPKPYGVIVMGELLPSIESRRGYFRSIYIWPYVAVGSFVLLDNAVNEITRLLGPVNGQPRRFRTNSGSYELEWVNEGRDFHDPDLDAFTRRMEYRIAMIR